MTEILLVRHGETQWNIEEVFRGRADIELNDTGLEQAKLLAEYLRNATIEAVYSSPLKRAVRTAETIANLHHLKVGVTPALTDMDFGDWECLPLKEVSERYPELYTRWENHPEKVSPPGGETLDDVRDRAVSLVNEVVVKHRGTVTLVSHRVVNKVLICALLGLDNSHFWNIRLDTCGLTAFTYENRRPAVSLPRRFVLTRHNDTSFLKPLKKMQLRDF
ncbi:MAG: histidine phosphatase family protein [Chloroflexi bacterium]|nr:histidine phosphatase family protein [Chloroflexota bacterium]